MILKSLLLVWLCVPVCLQAVLPRSELLRPKDRWVVVGDSITQNGTYYAWVALYYLTRYPDMDFSVVNAGISGDNATKALSRYSWDIACSHASVATVMFGMNDIGRSLYGVDSPSEKILQRRKMAMDDYQESLTTLVKRLKEDGMRVILLSPSPYDDTAEVKSENHKGANLALRACADYMRELSKREQVDFIDIHKPMTELNQQRQAQDPTLTLTGPDRIHPQTPGHVVAAYFMLTSAGVTGEVSNVVLDYQTKRVVDVQRATVSDLSFSPDEMSFTLLEEALPYPLGKYGAPAREWIPLEQSLSREVLRIKNLPSGNYRLSIDDIEIANMSAQELGQGVNLGTHQNTPQYLQAQEVLRVLMEWRYNVGYRKRAIAQIEYWTLGHLKKPVDVLTGVTAATKKREEVAQSADSKKDYILGLLDRYLEWKAREAEIDERIKRLFQQARVKARPVSHQYTIKRIAD
ncbi:SGNH/GDSL hydrolase family protein [Coraliomargarita algicola]|uniref:SGNH/GDSL hydrolase family protein n=1 Tax=Coraliomargarita algicola TaxID=3092156 RepID=A0ABZ0RGU5_9BACT|nr:SGNH/GDSL hydrolase family protein [Coraliomargarita sp. J2-16]WPJ94288.1 SGNH/GDSL hydrolase family protein [Coraliomargarita sp. J2-16]